MHTTPIVILLLRTLSQVEFVKGLDKQPFANNYLTMISADLQKFLEAQQRDYETALAEIKSGRKQGHWIWYIFPQVKGLGRSSTSTYYGIESLDQAGRYLRHPVLGKRLTEISRELLALHGKTANQILGNPDDLKVRSSMTLFSLLPETDPVFQAVLDKYYGGKPDPQTLAMVNG